MQHAADGDFLLRTRDAAGKSILHAPVRSSLEIAEDVWDSGVLILTGAAALPLLAAISLLPHGWQG